MGKLINNATIFQAMEEWAPRSLAYEWDNVGLQIGSYNKPVKKVMITLDVLESVVDEAIDNEVDLIIAHHPLLFKPLKQINIDTPIGRVIHKLIRHEITVYAAHTNLDIATGGVNDLLFDSLGLESKKNLVETETEQLFKLIVFVPVTHMDDIQDVLSDNGAGHIGNYSHSTFQSKGQGTFKPLKGTTPFIGKINELEIVDEVKIETIVREASISTVVESMIKAHPYEEVAYDLLPLGNQGNSYGIGRIGLLNDKMTLKDLSEHVKSTFNISHVRVIGDLTKKVKKVAILGGSGEKYIHKAKEMGAHVYITGDMSFHMAQDAQEMGLSVIDAGHYIEKIMKQATKNVLKEKFRQTELEIIVSETNTEPFQFV